MLTVSYNIVNQMSESNETNADALWKIDHDSAYTFS